MDDQGHLFLVRCDICRLSSDAFLIPANKYGGAGIHPDVVLGLYKRPNFEAEGKRTALYFGPNCDYGNHPVPWLVYANKVFSSEKLDQSVKWLLDGTRKFISEALKHLKKMKRTPRNRRAKYLFALPHVNTGAGGGHEFSGIILKELIPFLIQLAAKKNVDIALTSIRPSDFAAAQVSQIKCNSSVIQV